MAIMGLTGDLHPTHLSSLRLSMMTVDEDEDEDDDDARPWPPF